MSAYPQSLTPFRLHVPKNSFYSHCGSPYGLVDRDEIQYTHLCLTMV